jgi:Putative prokaryotic signal transducing protein
MSDDDIIVLRKFDNEAQANLAASILEANGVPARVAADTAGGAIPSLALVFPIRLLVRLADRELALELLDSEASPED